MTMRMRGVSMWVAVAVAAVVPAVGQTVESASQRPVSELDQQAQPAAIAFADGQLTIRAANSSLRAILDDLQTRTGTRIDGLSTDERIYGVYGPGNAQAVLASLLDDSGYNVLISGRNADGAPREIELSSRTAQASVPQPRGVTQAAAEADDSDDADSSPAPTAFMPPPRALPPPQAPAASGTPPQVKTPQEMLQELQRMRQSVQPQSPQ